MYSTIDTVTKKINKTTLIQLLNDEVRPEEEVDLTDVLDVVVIRFNEAAEEAQGEIDPYLRGRYTLPLATVPKIIISVSDSFTIYHCYERRNRENMPDSILSIRKEGLKLLEQIQKGILDLGVSGEPQNLSNEITVNKTDDDRIFNKDLLDLY
jgi:phage gp36-like protein